MANLVPGSFREKLERARATLSNVREKAKAGTKLVVHTALGAATAAGMGALDAAKGTSQDNDMGVQVAYVGPIPISLAVAGVAKVAALWQVGDETGELASAIGQGALDAFAYVEGQRMWKRHAAAQ